MLTTLYSEIMCALSNTSSRNLQTAGSSLEGRILIIIELSCKRMLFTKGRYYFNKFNITVLVAFF